MTYAEELGLTGYAIEPMEQRYSALMSGILLGLVWAGYHIPGFIISGYYSYGWIFWHALYTIASRILFVWVYNNAGKSLFSMALFHWSFGLFWSLWPTDNLQRAVQFYDPRICAAITILYVAIVTWLWGAKTLARYRFTWSCEQHERTTKIFAKAVLNGRAIGNKPLIGFSSGLKLVIKRQMLSSTIGH